MGRAEEDSARRKGVERYACGTRSPARPPFTFGKCDAAGENDQRMQLYESAELIVVPSQFDAPGASPCADGSLRCRRRCRAGGGDGAARQPGNGCCVHRELVARNALCAFGLHCEPVLHAGSEKTKRD